MLDIKRTKEYYQKLTPDFPCQCDYCKNYCKEIKAAYPKVAAYLESIGVDIELPSETAPMDPDENGAITYIFAQYDVYGDGEGFEEREISGVRIHLTENHPAFADEEMEKECVVVELTPITLPWTI